MIYKNIEFHNVVELERLEEIPGLTLQRFPSEVKNKLGYNGDERGRPRTHNSVGCEMRFVTDAKTVRVFLSALYGEGEVLVFKGNFFHSKHHIREGMINTLQLENSPKFEGVKPEAFQDNAFSKDVWRIFFCFGYCAVYHGIDTFGHEIRPPKEDEKPKVKWLAYGSSISNGGSASILTSTYLYQTAHRLKVDVMNIALGGACLCEKEVADFIAARDDWDFLTLEVGVNMRNIGMASEEFERRVRYLLNTILKLKPDKHIVILTMFPNSGNWLIDEENSLFKKTIEYDEIIRRLHKEMNNNNLHLIEGKEILTDFSGLSCDLLHPFDFGYIQMGENLANKLKAIPGLLE
jgi:hypothetical protein